MTQALREADLETKADHMLDSEQPPMQLSAVYQRRWKQVIAALREWEVDCLEAQVLWGPRIIDSVKPLRQHVYTLFASLETYLCYREEGLTQGDSAYADATKVVLHQRNDDAFEAEIQEAIEQLEKTLRPYLSLGLSTIGL
jgi:hypothetical protein